MTAGISLILGRTGAHFSRLRAIALALREAPLESSFSLPPLVPDDPEFSFLGSGHPGARNKFTVRADILELPVNDVMNRSVARLRNVGFKVEIPGVHCPFDTACGWLERQFL